MSRASKRCSAWIRGASVCALGFGCAGHGAAEPPHAPPAERRAPGVAESRSLTLPEPTRSGDSSEQLLSLRTPSGTEQARAVVRDFMRATVNEAPERLETLLSKQAYVSTSGGRQPARAFWLLRFAQLDYTELKGQLLYSDNDVQTFRVEDLARLPPARRPALELAQDEVAVRVPIHVSWSGRTRLYGDELLFRLQPSGGRFEIAEISEDFRLP